MLPRPPPWSLLCSLLFVACGDDGSGTGSGSDTTDGSGTTGAAASTTSGAPETTSTGSTTAVVDEGTSTTGEPCPAVEPGSEHPLLDVYELDGDDLYPEGIAWDPQTRSFYVGSLEHGTVTRVDADGSQSILAEPASAGWSTLGMKIDADARRLYACASPPVAEGEGEVWIYDLDGCGLIEQVALGDAAAGARCNDLALDPEGAALVTDPSQGIVYRVVSGQAAEVWAQDPLLEPEGPLPLGLNGIAVTPDGAYVIAANLAAQRLVRIDRADPTSVVEIALTGDPLPQGTDGLVFGGSEDVLHVVFDAEVKRVALADAYTTGDVTTILVPGFDSGLTTATVAEGAIYITEGSAVARAFGQAPDLPFEIVRLPAG